MTTILSPGRLSNLNDTPLQDTDAVNQNYVDGQSQKSSVKAASVSNVNISSPPATIDDVTINENDRVLLKDQTVQTENGIYILSGGILVRANGAETTDIASGCSLFVTDGTVNDNTQWQCTDSYGTLFGSAITFEKVQTIMPVGLNNSIVKYNSTNNSLESSGVLIDASENITTTGSFILSDNANTLTIASPTLTTSFTLTLPDTDGDPNQYLKTDGSGGLTWSSLTTSYGDVYGPVSSTLNAVSRFSDTSGKILKNSGLIVDDSTNVSGINNLTATQTTSNTLILGTPNTVTLNANPTSSYNLTLPTGTGTNGQYLQTDGTGVLSWVDNNAQPAGSNGYIQYKSGTAFSADSGLVWLNNILDVEGTVNLNQTTNSGTISINGTQINTVNLTFTDTSTNTSIPWGNFNSFSQPTLASSTAATVVDKSATLYIAGEPLDGTNVTISDSYALYVASGTSYFTNLAVFNSNVFSNGTITGDIITDGNATLSSDTLTVSTINASSITVSSSITDGTATLSSGILTGLISPSDATDAVNKNYVDSLAQGIQWKEPVKTTSTANFTLSGEQTMDGVATLAGDRVLLKDQNFPRQNGIWVVSTGAWTRASDLAEGSSASGVSVLVSEGATYASGGFVCNTLAGSDVVGNDAGTTGNDLTFVQFTGTSSVDAGSGLSKTGNLIDINTDDSTLEIVSDTLRVKDAGITSSKLALNSVTNAKILDSTIQNTKLQNSSLTVSAGDGLTSGGVVSLGGTVSLSVNTSVLRTTGDQSKNGILNITDTTQSTNKTTGCLILSGGLGVSKSIFCNLLNSSLSVTAASFTDNNLTISSGNITNAGTISSSNVNNSGTVTSSTFDDNTLTINNGNITNANNISSTSVTATTLTDGTASLNSGTLSGLVNPTNSTDATNKSYVDNVASGLKWQDPSRAATTGNITLSSEQTIDTVSVVSGDRVLVKDQTTASENGIYIVSTGSWTRSSDMAASVNAKNFAVFVEEGSSNIDTSYTVTGVSPYTVGTSDITWTKFASSATVTDGAGLLKTGNTMSVNVDNSTLEINADSLRVKDLGITNAKLASNSISTLKLQNSSVTNAKLQNSSLTVTAGDGLTTGGSVSLGSSVTLDVDTSVLRTSGSQSASGINSFTNTTQSVDYTTGGVVISGGLGVGLDANFNGSVDISSVLAASTLTDNTASLNSGTFTGLLNVNSVDITSTGTTTVTTLTDGTASLSSGSFTGLSSVNTTNLVLSIPNTHLLYSNNGTVNSNSGLYWNGTHLGATVLDAQNITRPNNSSQASLWSDGVGNIDIGLAATGTIQMGAGPMFKVTSTTSILQSALTLQGGFSRKYSGYNTTINTTGSVNYTATQIQNGIIVRDCNGANRVDVFPTAVDLVNIVPEPVEGSSIEFFVRNVSSGTELLTLNSNTGVTFSSTLTIAAGVTSRFIAVLTNISFGNEAVTVFVSVPKARVMIQASLIDVTQGGNVIKFASWGPITSATVDSTVLGYSGTIIQMVASYSTDGAIDIGAGESLTFDIGYSDATLTTFTPFTGGSGVITWDATDNGTYPSTSSGAISIAVSDTDRIAIRSTEVGGIAPQDMSVRFILTIELD